MLHSNPTGMNTTPHSIEFKQKITKWRWTKRVFSVNFVAELLLGAFHWANTSSKQINNCDIGSVSMDIWAKWSISPSYTNTAVQNSWKLLLHMHTAYCICEQFQLPANSNDSVWIQIYCCFTTGNRITLWYQFSAHKQNRPRDECVTESMHKQNNYTKNCKCRS